MAEQKGSYTAPLVATATTTAGAVLSLANPEGADIIITRFVVDVTTEATGTVNDADFGVAAGPTTTSATLLDGVDIGTAAAVFDNADGTDNGSGGKSSRKWGSTQYVTGNAKASTVGLVGNVYIEYIRV